MDIYTHTHHYITAKTASTCTHTQNIHIHTHLYPTFLSHIFVPYLYLTPLPPPLPHISIPHPYSPYLFHISTPYFYPTVLYNSIQHLPWKKAMASMSKTNIMSLGNSRVKWCLTHQITWTMCFAYRGLGQMGTLVGIILDHLGRLGIKLSWRRCGGVVGRLPCVTDGQGCKDYPLISPSDRQWQQ